MSVHTPFKQQPEYIDTDPSFALFTPVALLPSQQEPRTSRTSGPLRLMAAIVEEALNCLQYGYKTTKASHLYTQAREWFLHDDALSTLTFSTVAGYLGIEAEAARRKIRAQFPPAPPLTQRHYSVGRPLLPHIFPQATLLRMRKGRMEVRLNNGREIIVPNWALARGNPFCVVGDVTDLTVTRKWAKWKRFCEQEAA